MGQRQINIETTLCISTLEFTTSNQHRINVVYFNADMNNVRQRQNNVNVVNVNFFVLSVLENCQHVP